MLHYSYKISRLVASILVTAWSVLMVAPCVRADADDGSGLVDEIKISVEARQRYEAQVGRYRANLIGSDDVIVLRTLPKIEARKGRLTGVVELIDSRIYLDDDATPVNTTQVNPVDVLEAYIKVDMSDWLGAQKAYVRLGRQTLDITSRRLVARNGYRNTINGYSGIHGFWEGDSGDKVNAFFFFTVGRQPSDRDRLSRNVIDFDEENFNQTLFGAHWQHPLHWFGDDRTHLELGLFGLYEVDDSDFNTADRELWTPQFRLYRKPKRGTLDLDLELAYQVGERSASTSNLFRTDLDVSAGFVHAALGYTFDTDWSVRVAAEFDWAEGDGDTSDGSLNRFDTLGGVRRREFGNTGIYGVFSRDNILGPGVRVSFKRGLWDGRVKWLLGYLDDRTDRHRASRIADQSGASGRLVGHDISWRLRRWFFDKKLRVEVGGSYLIKGRFLREAPGVADPGDVAYGFVQTTFTF